MNEKTTSALDAVFEIAPPITTDLVVSPTDGLPAVVVEDEIAARAEEDFVFSRAAIKAIAAEAQTSLKRCVEVADMTDKASSFEAVAEMVRATLEAHRELQNIHRTAAEIRLTTQSASNPPGTVNIQQGVVFTGTSEDLLKLISKERK